MLDSVLVPLLIVGLFVGAVVWAVYSQRRRREALAAVAQRLGFEFSAAMDAGPYPQLGRERGAWHRNLLLAKRQGVRIATFDLSYRRGSRRHRRVAAQTVVRLESPQLALPEFVLEPTSPWRRAVEWLGVRDIDFSGDPVFSREFVLRGSDEVAVRTLFTEPVRRCLAEHCGLSAEGGPGVLFLYRHRQLAAPEQIEALALEAAAIYQAFVGARPALPVPPG